MGWEGGKVVRNPRGGIQNGILFLETVWDGMGIRFLKLPPLLTYIDANVGPLLCCAFILREGK